MKICHRSEYTGDPDKCVSLLSSGQRKSVGIRVYYGVESQRTDTYVSPFLTYLERTVHLNRQ